MVVRIRLQTGRPVQRRRGKNRHVALAGGALLIPVSLMAYVLGFWGLASDMGMAGGSGIEGIFSHWQLWIAGAAAFNVMSSILNRYGRSGEMQAPSVLTPRFLSFRGSAEEPDSQAAPREARRSRQESLSQSAPPPRVVHALPGSSRSSQRDGLAISARLHSLKSAGSSGLGGRAQA